MAFLNRKINSQQCLDIEPAPNIKRHDVLCLRARIMCGLSLLLLSLLHVPVVAADNVVASRENAELLQSMKEAVLSGTCSGIDSSLSASPVSDKLARPFTEGERKVLQACIWYHEQRKTASVGNAKMTYSEWQQRNPILSSDSVSDRVLITAYQESIL
ncbi:hypothetical protein ACN09C_27720 (plasmid) [Serratia fonticola]|uniref:hypothetical protein n=1 Tax=Serratia fonticola TaxID=47917 RepID=UPI003B000689